MSKHNTIKMNRKRQVKKQKMMLIMVFTIVFMILSILCKGILTDAHGSRNEDPIQYQYYTSIQIQAGDTLSSIAKKYRSTSDNSTTDYITKLKKMNHLSSDEIHEGQYLMVSYENEFH